MFISINFSIITTRIGVLGFWGFGVLGFWFMYSRTLSAIKDC